MLGGLPLISIVFALFFIIASFRPVAHHDRDPIWCVIAEIKYRMVDRNASIVPATPTTAAVMDQFERGAPEPLLVIVRNTNVGRATSPTLFSWPPIWCGPLPPAPDMPTA
jgi:hypothetical protein